MATRRTSTPEPETSTALAERPRMDLATRPDFIKEGDVRGTENITSKDIQPPSLRLAQAMTPEAKRSEPVYIDGLAEGLLFNSVTHEIYGEKVRFLIVNQLGSRHIEFAPLDEGGGVLDFNVPDGDPRTQFTDKVVDGKTVRMRPVATKFYDYLILLLHDERQPELMTMSLKSTQLKKAVQLNTLVKASKMPSFAFVIEASTVPEKKTTYSWFGWKFEPAGWPTEEQYNAASEFYNKLSDTKIVVDDVDNPADAETAGAGDDAPF